ncbi:MAG: U32 family peptidase, partial [Oscillospiraceae bacterium]|nr:U32 family peptidase [Oscillospiraceae bacterium]
IIFPIRGLLSHKKNIDSKIAPKITAELDRFAFSNDEFTLKALETVKQMGIERVMVQNIGQLTLVKNKGFKITFGPFMNTTNSRALELLSENCVDRAVASFELSQKSLSELMPFTEIEALVYGYLPLMLTRACPKKSVSDCSFCAAKSSFLVDRKGSEMRIFCRGAVSEIYNCVPLCAPVENSEFKKADFLLCYFTVESPERCRQVLSSIKNGICPECREGFTRGLYKNGAI